MNEQLTHFDKDGHAIMVDVTEKQETVKPNLKHTNMLSRTVWNIFWQNLL